MVGTTEHYVRHEGIHTKAAEELAAALPKPTPPAAKRLRKALLAFVEDEAGLAQDNERLLGPSEILESIICKIKDVLDMLRGLEQINHQGNLLEQINRTVANQTGQGGPSPGRQEREQAYFELGTEHDFILAELLVAWTRLPRRVTKFSRCCVAARYRRTVASEEPATCS